MAEDKISRPVFKPPRVNALPTELKHKRLVRASASSQYLAQAYATLELLISDGTEQSKAFAEDRDPKGDGFEMAHGNVIDALKAVKHLICEVEEHNNALLRDVRHGNTEAD